LDRGYKKQLVNLHKTSWWQQVKNEHPFPGLFIFCLVADGFAYGRLRCHVDDYWINGKNRLAN
jgi:hypothetical protein